MNDNLFSEDPVSVADRLAAEALIVDVDGFEGPLDVLLTLSRTQKVDLRKISVLALAQQYLAFVEKARALRIELAADYLVMAAWLAFLKSRLLLPPDPDDEGPSGEELAAHLAFQLERLQAMRDAAARLMARDQLGRDFFRRGQGEDVTRIRTVTYSATLLDLMQGYARIRTRDEFRPFVMDRDAVFTMEQALERMRPTYGDEAKRELCADPTAQEDRDLTDAPKDDGTGTLFEAPPLAEQERMVEAVLFASAEPVTIADLEVRMPHGSDAAQAVEVLQKRYEGRGVRVVKVGEAWAIRTAPDLGFLMQKETVETRKLSRAAIETLAIVAYHQPCTRAEIEEIRGVSVSRGTIDQLLEMEWIRLGRRRMTPGRPVTFVVTPQFLDHFGLENARDLPGLKELRAAGLLENRPPPGAMPIGEGSDDEADEDQTELFEEE